MWPQLNIPYPAAIAVSGGADSLALLLIAHQQGNVVALTVDHGLRSESRAEAEAVHAWAQQHGIPHHILTWQGPKPRTRIQETAREVRYKLLTDWCKTNSIPTLVLGHHQNDQEETFWLRLAGGSGLEGLGGMEGRVMRDGVTIVRPLLDIPKSQLRAILEASKQPWMEDPSNTRGFRGKLRRVLQDEGLNTLRLTHTMAKLRQDADFIRQSVAVEFQKIVQLHAGGYMTVDQTLLTLHPAISTRILSLCARWFTSSAYPSRINFLERLQTGKPFTAAGIYWFLQGDKIYLTRELAAASAHKSLKSLNFWDGRFRIHPHGLPADVMIGCLGEGDKTFLTAPPAHIPRRIWPTLPAFFRKERIVAVPHLGYTDLAITEDVREIISVSPFVHNSLTPIYIN